MPSRTKQEDSDVSIDASMEDAPPSAQPVAVEDAEMKEEDQEEEEEEIEPQRVRIVCRTAVFSVDRLLTVL